MRRRDFAIALLLTAEARTLLAQQPEKQRRIAVIIPAGPIVSINDPGQRIFRGFWEELRRLGDVEGQNLTVERYSGEGQPEGFADLARAVVSRSPEAVIAVTEPIVRAVRTASGTVPIVGGRMGRIGGNFDRHALGPKAHSGATTPGGGKPGLVQLRI